MDDESRRGYGGEAAKGGGIRQGVRRRRRRRHAPPRVRALQGDGTNLEEEVWVCDEDQSEENC